QRRGLGVSLGERRYVVHLDAEKNRITLGSKEALKSHGLIAKEVHWMGRGSHESWVMSHESCVKIRSTHKGVTATMEDTSEGLRVTFANPQEAVTPGQAAVFYAGDEVVGGGIVARVRVD
ncbi:MAG: tRNA 2-thiouridine(34) synthase MnmA, partial [Candidatus Limnocylindria bacterium]|nr:tRNA 2-thiouridine(34) synthase MnmA [Candidatus Limnocylindria bacterium]